MERISMGHYHVDLNVTADALVTTCTTLRQFAAMLPHGSGFDSSYRVLWGRRTVTLHTEWHAMNEHGYYCGYWPVRVVLDRNRGVLSLRSVRVNARATNDAGDYIADCFVDVCREANAAQAQAQPEDGGRC